jgi:hypothetical protein
MSVLRRPLGSSQAWLRAWLSTPGAAGLEVFRLTLCNLDNMAGGLARSRRRLWSMDVR